MKTSQRLRASLRELRLDIDALLKRAGFTRQLRSIWVRPWGWKEDVVELRLVGTDILLNLYVEVPSRNEGEISNDVVALKGLGHIIGNKFPVLPFGSIPSKAAVSGITTSLEKGLGWFDEFASPRACLEALRRSGIHPESISFRQIAAYLASLPSD